MCSGDVVNGRGVVVVSVTSQPPPKVRLRLLVSRSIGTYICTANMLTRHSTFNVSIENAGRRNDSEDHSYIRHFPAKTPSKRQKTTCQDKPRTVTCLFIVVSEARICWRAFQGSYSIRGSVLVRRDKNIYRRLRSIMFGRLSESSDCLNFCRSQPVCLEPRRQPDAHNF